MSMFKRISYRIAFQFTAFVLLLLLFNGALFFAADYENARRTTYDRLGRSVEIFTREENTSPEITIQRLPPPMRDRLRILSPQGKPLFTSNVFFNIPIPEEIEEGLNTIIVQEEPYSVLTTPIMRHGNIEGYVQVVGAEFGRASELPLRIMIYLFVCAAISALIFLIGLYFARRSLKPAEQMVERLEQFTQDASHELRTPLATLNSSLDLALKTKEYKKGIDSAKEDIARITELVERLLELARLDRLLIDTENVDLSSLIEETIERLEPLAAEKNITIERTIVPSLHKQGDSALLRQVLNNLLMNAMKYTDAQGTIRVQLTEKSLTVKDTGTGIDVNDLPHIFDRFYQAEPSRSLGGFGLGLSLVKRIVELHGWTITAENTKPKGAIFIMKF